LSEQSIYNEQELLKGVANGEEKAFERLFEHHRSRIYSFALRIIGDEFTAKEVVQDTFLKVWLKRQELNLVSNFGGWLYKIAERFTYNALTKTTREKTYFDQWLAEAKYKDDHEDGNATAENRDFLSVLNQAINRLSPKQKLTYQLLKEQGFTRAEAAEKLQVSAETVKWNLDKAMSSIRAYCISQLQNPNTQIILFLIAENIFDRYPPQ
jgi:RNA polymerase sigma factor (sigma-70 family)